MVSSGGAAAAVKLANNFQYPNNVVAVKWFDIRGVTMVGTCLEECDKISTVSRRVKGQC